MIRIIPFEPSYNQEVAELIVTIQREEFNLPIKLADQPDLFNIKVSYQTKGNFWLAFDTKESKVVGCIGLVSLTNDNVALKKMFVFPAYRKDGVGRKLVETFLNYCQDRKKRRVYLGTNSAFETAQLFYQRLGFQEIKVEDLPSDFPVVKVDNRFYLYCLH